MIRNLIDYSEYRIQRSNFEFWDQLIIKKIRNFQENGRTSIKVCQSDE